MDLADKIDTVTTMTGEENDKIIEIYLKQARSEILAFRYPFGFSKVAPETLDSYIEQHVLAQIRICVYLLNKRGAEGQISHSEGGVGRSYGSDNVPLNYFSGIIPLASVVTSSDVDTGGNTDETIESKP